MDFVWMKHDGVELPAKVPASAAPHWEGHGWVKVDPPAKPAPPVKPDTTSPPTTSTESPVDAPTSAKTKTAKAPSGRKED